MGYRSSVYIKAKKFHTEPLEKIFTETALTEYFTKHQDGDYVYYLGSDLKWYAGFDDVSAVNNYVESFDEDDSADVTISLITIGEDNAAEQINIMDDFCPIADVDGFARYDDMRKIA